MKKLISILWKELTMPVPFTNVQIETGGIIISLALFFLILFIFHCITGWVPVGIK